MSESQINNQEKRDNQTSQNQDKFNDWFSRNKSGGDAELTTKQIEEIKKRLENSKQEEYTYERNNMNYQTWFGTHSGQKQKQQLENLKQEEKKEVKKKIKIKIKKKVKIKIKKKKKEYKKEEEKNKLLKLGQLGEHAINLQNIDNNLNGILKDILLEKEAKNYTNKNIYKAILECKEHDCEKQRLSELARLAKDSLIKIEKIKTFDKNLAEKIKTYKQILSDINKDNGCIKFVIRDIENISDKLSKDKTEETPKSLLNDYQKRLQSLQEILTTNKNNYKNISSYIKETLTPQLAKCKSLNNAIDEYRQQLNTIFNWTTPMKVKQVTENVRQLFESKCPYKWLLFDNQLYLPYQKVDTKTRNYIQIPIINNKLSVKDMKIVNYNKGWKVKSDNKQKEVQDMLQKQTLTLHNSKNINFSLLKDREIQIDK